MSDPDAHRKRDKFLKVWPFSRSRSPSPTNPARSPSYTPADQPIIRADPVTTAAPSPPHQISVPNQISLDEVLAELKPQQKDILRQHCPSTATDIGDSIREALGAAEQQKQVCNERRWKITIGAKTIVLHEKADKVVTLIHKFKELGTMAASADPVHAGLPWAGICLMLQFGVATKEQMDALLNGMITVLSMQRTADLYFGFYQKQPAGDAANELRRSLLKLYATILGFFAEALHLWKTSGASRLWNALTGDGELQKFPTKCRDDLVDVERAASMCDRYLEGETAALVADTKANATDILAQLEDLRADAAFVRSDLGLAKLPIAPNAEFDSYDQQALPTCLPKTRTGLLDDIGHWADDPADTCIFWLQGIAGEGKSTVAKTVATTLQRQNKLGASFFFKRDDSDRANARRFFTTVAAQLARKVDGLKNAIASTLNEELVKYEKSIRDQFRDLIANPLQKISQHSQPKFSGFVIVVDALDECFDDDVNLILELLAQIHHCGSFGIRTFVTGRPDVSVKNAFSYLEHKQYRHVVLQDHTRNAISHDINLYLTEQFKVIRRRLPVSHDDWPGRDMIQELTKRSVPLFIFAATVCKFIASDDFTPEEQLQAVLAESSSVPLARTYLPVLNRLVADKSSKQATLVIERFRNLVGPVVVAAEPMPVQLFMRLPGLTDREQLKARLGRLHSVLHLGIDDETDRTIHTFHASFKDFLTEPEEPHDFQIDERQAHTTAAKACLLVMMQTGKLHQDICAVSKPGTRRLEVDLQIIKSHLEPDLAYACLHWAHHQERSGVLIDDDHEVYKFLATYFLYWFEAMAWLGKANEVLNAVEKLRSLERTHGSCDLTKFLDDAYYFARENQYIVDLAPLQLYASALVFAPEHSPVKSRFDLCMPHWLVHSPKVDQTWDHDTLTLEGHTGHINAIAFSLDDNYLATCSYDKTLRIYEASTGKCVSVISSALSEQNIVDIAFSPDSHRIAAAYTNYKDDRDFLIIIYDITSSTVVQKFDRKQTGRPIDEPVNAMSPHIRVTFTPTSNDTVFVVTLSMSMLEVWRAEAHSGNCERVWRAGTSSSKRRSDIHEDQSLAISSDTCLVLCEGRITCWLLESGTPSSTSIVEDSMVYSVALRGTDVVYVTKRGEQQVLQRLSMQTGHLVKILTKIGSSFGTAIATAHTSDRFAHIIGGKPTVQIREMTQVTGLEVQAHKGPPPEFVHFTLNGELILVKYPNSLEFLDVEGKLLFRSPPLHFRPPSSDFQAAISHDGGVVFAQQRGEARVWYVESGELQQHPGILTTQKTTPAISNDGKLLLLIFLDNCLTFDLQRGQEIRSVKLKATLDSFSLVPRVWLSEDEKSILVDTESFDLETGHWNASRPDLIRSPIDLDLDREWITFKHENLLWLPPQYRPRSIAYSSVGSTLVIGRERGCVIVLRFTNLRYYEHAWSTNQAVTTQAEASSDYFKSPFRR